MLRLIGEWLKAASFETPAWTKPRRWSGRSSRGVRYRAI